MANDITIGGVAATADQLKALRVLSDKQLAVVAAQTASADGDPYMLASHRMYWPIGTSTVGSGGEEMINAYVHYSPSYETRGHRFCFVGFWVDQTSNTENNFSAPLKFEGVAIEINGVRKPLKVNGSQQFTVAPGATVWTDEDPSIVVPPNSVFRQIVYTKLAIGDLRASTLICCPTKIGSDGISFGSGSLATAFASGNIGGPNYFFGPAASMIVAKGWAAANALQKRAVVFVNGDSIPEGSGDTHRAAATDGELGGIGRGLSSKSTSEFIPHMLSCRYGVPFSTATSFAKRQAALSSMGFPFTTILSELGGNNSQAATEYPNFVQYCKTQLGGRKFVQQTLLQPKSTLTAANVGWTNIGNQTSKDNIASTMNPLVRAGTVPGQDDYLETAGTCDSGRSMDDPTWKVGPLTGQLMADMAAGSSEVILNFTPSQFDTLDIGAGTASHSTGMVVREVSPNYPVPGQTTVYFFKMAGTNACTAGAPVCTVFTNDGIHPTPQGSVSIAAAVIANKGKLINAGM